MTASRAEEGQSWIGPADQAPRHRKRPTWIRLGVPTTILVLLIVGTLTSPNFLTVSNLLNVLTSVSIVGIIALGMSFVVISGAWADLSVPAVIAAGAIVLLSAQPMVGTGGALILALLVGAVAGCINGGLVAYLRASPIVITLGSNIVILGIAQALVRGKIVYNDDAVATAIVNGRLLGVPFVAIVFLVLATASHVVLSRTVWGRWTVATGGNYEAALASGVPVRLIRGGAFVLTGVLSAISGCLLALSLQSVRPVIGLDYDFAAFAAIVVGGVSLLGGFGGIPRVLGGLFVVQLLINIMVLLGLPNAAQGFAKGLVIVVAVALDIKLRGSGEA
jgi:ribose/xylose/arabinose/galactoside ABC-type transport system permease subunit